MNGKHSFGRRQAGVLFGWAFSAIAAVGLAGAAQAVSLQASPVTIHFDPTEEAEALILANSGVTPLEAQVRVQRWSQREGADQLEPASDIIATPAIVRIAPGERQTVRLVRRDAVAPAQELTYRVLVDELPRTAGQDGGGAGVNVLLRYSIPVFVAARQSAPPPQGSTPPGQTPVADLSTIHARLAAGADGTTQLQVRNDGPTHLRISRLGIHSGENDATPVVPGLVGYVLAGQQMSFPAALPASLPAGQTLKARFNDDRETRPVPLDRVGP